MANGDDPVESTAKALEDAIKSVDTLNVKIRKGSDLASVMFKDAQKDLKKLTDSMDKNRVEKHLASAAKESEKLKKSFEAIEKVKPQEILKETKKEAKELEDAWKDLRKETDRLTPSLSDLEQSITYLPKDFKDVSKEIADFNEKVADIQLGNVFDDAAKKAPPFKDRVKDLMTAFEEGNPVLSSFIGFIGAVASKLWDVLKRAFTETRDYINNYLLPTYSDLNKEFGNTKNIDGLKHQAVALGDEFRKLGLSFQQGANAVKELASEMNNPRLTDKALKTLVKISEYSGLGAKKTGEFANVFEALGGNVGQLDKAFESAKNITGIPNKLRRELGENINLVIRFGAKNIDTAKKSINSFMKLRLSVKEVTQAFGEQLDTFEATSDASAKLNTVFGTNIDSFKLLLETDPAKRLAMVRNELEKQGKSFYKLNVFEQNVLASTLQLSKEEAAKAFASKKVRDELEKQSKAQEDAAKTSKEWNRGVVNLQKTLLNMEAELQSLFMAIGNVVSRFLGFDNGIEATTKGTELFKNLIKDATYAINDIAKSIDPAKTSFHGFKGVFEKVSEALKKAPELFDQISGTVKSTSDSIRSLADSIQNLLQPIDSFKARGLKNEFKELSSKSFEDIKKFENEASSSESVRARLLQKLGLTETEFNKQLNELENKASKNSGAQVEHLPGRTVFNQQVTEKQNDAFISKDGKIIPISDQDNILAKKNMGSNQQIVVKIEPADIYLDGKKIAEVQFKNSTL